MAKFNSGNIKIGPGTIYAAPLGTTEPTAVTGAWPTGWVDLGYTDSGSTWTSGITTDQVTVEEELLPVRFVPTGAASSITFALAEDTVDNFILAVNGGIGAAQLSGVTGANTDGSIWVEQPTLGTEVRVMIGWDANPKAGTGASVGDDAFGRLILRRCLQTGNLSETHRKGNNKKLINCTFSLEIPAGSASPWRKIYPAALAA
jgi:hypothetical protein